MDLTTDSPPRKKNKIQSKMVVHTTQLGPHKVTSFMPSSKVNITTIEKQNVKNVNCNNSIFGSNNS